MKLMKTSWFSSDQFALQLELLQSIVDTHELLSENWDSDNLDYKLILFFKWLKLSFHRLWLSFCLTGLQWARNESLFSRDTYYGFKGESFPFNRVSTLNQNFFLIFSSSDNREQKCTETSDWASHSCVQHWVDVPRQVLGTYTHSLGVVRCPTFQNWGALPRLDFRVSSPQGNCKSRTLQSGIHESQIHSKLQIFRPFNYIQIAQRRNWRKFGSAS